MLSMSELKKFGSEERSGSMDGGESRGSIPNDPNGVYKERSMGSRMLANSVSVDEDGGMLIDEMGRYDGRLGSKWSFLKTLKEKKAEEKENPTTVVNIVHSELVSCHVNLDPPCTSIGMA
jgi:hypothetical protein